MTNPDAQASKPTQEQPNITPHDAILQTLQAFNILDIKSDQNTGQAALALAIEAIRTAGVRDTLSIATQMSHEPIVEVESLLDANITMAEQVVKQEGLTGTVLTSRLKGKGYETKGEVEEVMIKYGDLNRVVGLLQCLLTLEGATN